jgi:hypothetical protein
MIYIERDGYKNFSYNSVLISFFMYIKEIKNRIIKDNC